MSSDPWFSHVLLYTGSSGISIDKSLYIFSKDERRTRDYQELTESLKKKKITPLVYLSLSYNIYIYIYIYIYNTKELFKRFSHKAEPSLNICSDNTQPLFIKLKSLIQMSVFISVQVRPIQKERGVRRIWNVKETELFGRPSSVCVYIYIYIYIYSIIWSS